MSRKRQRRQVTCYCRAYHFPHRIGGGQCSGSAWSASYHELIQSECQYCNSNNQGRCDVADGIESCEECEGYEDHLRRGVHTQLPMNVDELAELLYGYRQADEGDF